MQSGPNAQRETGGDEQHVVAPAGNGSQSGHNQQAFTTPNGYLIPRFGPPLTPANTTEALITSDDSVPGEQIAVVPVTAASESGGEGVQASDGASSRRRILTAATVIMVGSLFSSILGMVRIEALNIFFYGAASGAFVIALRPIQQLSDLLVGGSVSGALIPTFVDYSNPEQRAELRRVFNTVFNLVAILMALAVGVLVFIAPTLIPFYLAKEGHADQGLTVRLVQIAALALFGLGLYAATSGLLYALRDVVYPAFATGIQHVGVIVCGVVALIAGALIVGVPLGDIFRHETGGALDMARTIGAYGLAGGLVLGALCEVVILIPGLRKAHISWRPVLDIRHPAVRQIVRLYAPIAAGLILSVAQQNLEIYLLGHAPGGVAENATALQSATTLVQFPTGLVAAALSFAVLPPLTDAANRRDTADFKRTLVLGFRLGLLLMIPAAVGLIALRTPIMALLFQHGTCQHGCTVRNALALQNYAYQLPFLALDQLLIAAFYARKNTIIPVVVGVVSIGFWALVAVPFATTIGLPAIALANAALNSGHAIILLVLLTLAIGNLGWRELGGGLARIVLAAIVMGLVCWGGLLLLPHLSASLFTLDNLRGQALTVILVGGAASLAYFALVAALRVEEVGMLAGIVRARLGGRKQ
ncbi:MAG: lipid II flippase MurJ [Ktedonobacterales bacterium]